MSTRALYTFKDQNGEYHVYKHHDGYPSGALSFIDAARAHAWQLPRFEADDFAAAFVAANKGTGGGGVRLTQGASWQDACSGDSEYHYMVTCKDGTLHVQADEIDFDDDDKPIGTQLNAGSLAVMLEWAKTA